MFIPSSRKKKVPTVAIALVLVLLVIVVDSVIILRKLEYLEAEIVKLKNKQEELEGATENIINIKGEIISIKNNLSDLRYRIDEADESLRELMQEIQDLRGIRNQNQNASIREEASLYPYYDCIYWDRRFKVPVQEIEDLIASIPPDINAISEWVLEHIKHTARAKKPADSFTVGGLLSTVADRGYAVSTCQGISMVWCYLVMRKGVGIPILLETESTEYNSRLGHMCAIAIVNGELVRFYVVYPYVLIHRVYVFDPKNIYLPAEHGIVKGAVMP